MKPLVHFGPTFAFAVTALSLLLPVRAPAQDVNHDRDEIVHVLNRITFGPAPGDVEAVQQMGLRAYIDQQLHPDQIDDSAVEQQVAGFEMLQWSPEQLADLERTERAARELKRKQELAAAGINGTNSLAGAAPTANLPGPGANPPVSQFASNAGIAPNPPPANATDIQPPGLGQPMDPATMRERMQDQLKNNRSAALVGEMQQAKLIRAVESKRQLQEVLVDFWSNHFNIDVKKGPDRLLKAVDDREVIRPNVLGKFRDLLEASAKSPAMLVYLDNALSTVPRIVTEREAMRNEQRREQMMAEGNAILAPPEVKAGDKRGGINENYAREIMELHTLGVDGGYTQQDVQEVARCFTGWTIDRATGDFVFRPRLHDDGQKLVLGHVIPAGGGIQDGESVLDILASSPATAHHIALEMCQRFVSDDPAPELVNRIAGVFRSTDGDLRAVTEAILLSPEFLSPANYNNKIKSPLEFAVSAVRATGSSLVIPTSGYMEKTVSTMEGAGTLGREKAIDRANKRPHQSLNWHIYDLGEPLFGCTPPTGYTEVSRMWVSPGALIERLNFALALTEQKVSDVDFDPQTLFSGTDLDKPDVVLDRAVSALLQDHVSDSTRKVLQQTAVPPTGASQTVNPNKLVALIIGSPEFQRK
jgi:uncharacterized protein (DUF1800 family)